MNGPWYATGHSYFRAQVTKVGIAAIFLDGGYIEKVVRFDHHEAHIDFHRLVTVMAGSDELLRAYYYHCQIGRAHV